MAENQLMANFIEPTADLIDETPSIVIKLGFLKRFLIFSCQLKTFSLSVTNT